ncbi:hypothetical protein, partial [Mycobacteroides abscessus]|uniref:hypothetical protein n=1 Tax=Mycobacteroides abscessus TaxID=36809 RepID=UPI0019CFA063
MTIVGIQPQMTTECDGLAPGNVCGISQLVRTEVELPFKVNHSDRRRINCGVIGVGHWKPIALDHAYLYSQTGALDI